MRVNSSGALIDELRRYKLLTPDQFAHLPNLAQGRSGKAQTMAKTLGQRGWLTIYQINQLLAGNAKKLIIGPYHILDLLGTGGLSHVFKARHTEFDLVVALKVIRPEVMSDPEGQAHFLQEIEAMTKLDHHNIVQFCDADEAGDSYFFAMEFIDGTDLGKVVRLSGRLPVEQACDYIRQTALGLQHAYEHNLVHRDIKPVNLFLTTEWVAGTSKRGKKIQKARALIKILDWGLASIRRPRGSAGAADGEPLSGGVVGTADYLSPEQAQNAAVVDIRGDIYSLGCTFYFLLTGLPPFPTGSLMQKLIQHQQAEPEPVETVRKDVPAEVTAVLKRMMAKQPADRFQTPAAVALALAPFIQSPAVSLPTKSTHSRLPTEVAVS